MAQFIRTPCAPDFNEVSQVTQCSYHEERVFEIFYDDANRKVLIQEFHNYFWLTSPDIDNLTVLQVLEALGYADEQIVITWADNNLNDSVLNSIVQQAPLSQLSIYPPNQPIPENPYQGPLPAVAGEPIPVDAPAADADAPDAPDTPNPNEPDFIPFQENNNDEPDDNSTISDIPNFRIVDHFGDSDDDYRHYD
jgi:hypothetical protein